MAKEILAVPEEYLDEFCQVLMYGLQNFVVSPQLKEQLLLWIQEEREYLNRE